MLHLCAYGCFLRRPLQENGGHRKRHLRVSKATPGSTPLQPAISSTRRTPRKTMAVIALSSITHGSLRSTAKLAKSVVSFHAVSFINVDLIVDGMDIGPQRSR